MSVISLPVSKATFSERPTVRDYCLVSCIPMGWDIEVPLLMNSSFPFYREAHIWGPPRKSGKARSRVWASACLCPRYMELTAEVVDPLRKPCQCDRERHPSSPGRLRASLGE